MSESFENVNDCEDEYINNNKSDNSSTSDLPFFDSGDFCQICQFNLNDPIKRGKKVVKCTRCLEYVCLKLDVFINK